MVHLVMDDNLWSRISPESRKSHILPQLLTQRNKNQVINYELFVFVGNKLLLATTVYHLKTGPNLYF